MAPKMHNAGKIILAEELADIFIKYIIKFNSGAWTPYFPDNSTANFLYFEDKIKGNKEFGTTAFMKSVALKANILLVEAKDYIGDSYPIDKYNELNKKGNMKVVKVNTTSDTIRRAAEIMIKDNIELLPDSMTIISKHRDVKQTFKGTKESYDWGDETPKEQQTSNATKSKGLGDATPETQTNLNTIETPAETKRRKVIQEVLSRPEQAKFRKKLLREYNGTCMVTGCNTKEALEAAHIKPVSKGGTDCLDNGLLLRADLHLLFDKKFMAIEPNTDDPNIGIVHFSKDAGDHYKKYEQIKINTSIVSRETLVARWQEFNKESE